jgi:cytochrome b561
MNEPISDSDISTDDVRSMELDFAICGSSDIRGNPIPAGDDTKHVSACSTTDAITVPAYTMTARVLHWLTAFLILAMLQPFCGWIATSAYRAPIPVFGLFNLPPIWPENRAFSEQLFFVHNLMGIAIAGLAAAHIGAALYHHFVRKDRVLMRMITG